MSWTDDEIEDLRFLRVRLGLPYWAVARLLDKHKNVCSTKGRVLLLNPERRCYVPRDIMVLHRATRRPSPIRGWWCVVAGCKVFVRNKLAA